MQARGLASSSGKEANFIAPMHEQSSTGRTYTRDAYAPVLRRGISWRAQATSILRRQNRLFDQIGQQ